MEEGTVIVHAKHLQGDVIGSFGLPTDEIANLFLAILVMLDELTGARGDL